ncbi:hypothetical protein F5X99DRAFT_408360 [Biscogniauxia marginata]|nr:hypothetical protein F5X99DRAFT_408360 [Biscogniauxia marginata]
MANASFIDLTDPDESQRVVDELKRHFATIPIWEYEKYLGDGEYAVTILVKEKDPSGPGQRVAIKRGKGINGEIQLRNEIKWLRRLRGAEHCVQMLAGHDDPTPPSSANPIGNSQVPMKTALEGLTRPVLGMEYLENGTLSRLMARLRKKRVHLPNRVLWCFFLCLVRACVGLAYPPNGGEYEPSQLETIPTDGRAPTDIYHGDLHSGNIMIGNPDFRFAEHFSTPVIKFIDFGETEENKEWGRMLGLIARQEVRLHNAKSQYKGIETVATEILPHGQGARYPTLDPELRDFLARCLATDEANRPSLEEMLRVTENAVQTKNAQSFAPHEALESEVAIGDVLQRVLFDADTS